MGTDSPFQLTEPPRKIFARPGGPEPEVLWPNPLQNSQLPPPQDSQPQIEQLFAIQQQLRANMDACGHPNNEDIAHLRCWLQEKFEDNQGGGGGARLRRDGGLVAVNGGENPKI